MNTLYIKDEDQLKLFSEALLNNTRSVTIDTEFHRQNTYYAIPALVQVAYKHKDNIHAAVIDAKTVKNWSSLYLALLSCDECVMHSSDQDFEIFDLIFGEWEFSIRDTQIASALLGSQPQLGYAALIKQEVGIELDKSQTRTNWLQRPLTKKQIDYAISDVSYLLEAWDRLKARLIEKSRWKWFEEDCARLLPAHKHSLDVKESWKKVKGIRNLARDEFIRAACLAEWREKIARTEDKPRRWVVDDKLILELAEQPDALTVLAKKIPILQAHLSDVRERLNTQEHGCKTLNYTGQPLNQEEKKRYQAIKQYMQVQAETLQIEPNSLVNRKTMEKMARGDIDFLEKNNWRHKILKEYLDLQLPR